MKKLLLIILPLLLIACNFDETKKSLKEVSEQKKEVIQSTKSMTTYYIIRHAEKDRTDANNKNPDLSEKGKLRAQNWAKVFKDVDFDAIYVTKYNRTKQTAQPTAQSQSLKVEVYNPDDLFNADFKKNTEGKTVLIVGHSDTNPKMTNKILGVEKYKDIADDENGSLYILNILPNQTKIVKTLYINQW